MRRRTLLASLAVVETGSVAGCLGGHSAPVETVTTTTTDTGTPTSTGTTDRTYRTCPKYVIGCEEFPEPVRDEIDAALADGEYVADRVLLAEAMDTNEGYVRCGETYYVPNVEREGGEEVLTLTEDPEPELADSRALSIDNRTDEKVVVRVENEDGRRS